MIATHAPIFSSLDIYCLLKMHIIESIPFSYDRDGSCSSPICLARSMTSVPNSSPHIGHSNSNSFDMFFVKIDII